MTFTQPNVDLPAPRLQRPLKVMIVAGEVSGDQHAARLVAELRQQVPNLEVFGMGGSHLRRGGMEIVIDAEQHASVMGFTEVVGSLRRLLHALQKLEQLAKSRRPDVVVLLDFPDFNLRLAKKLKRQGIKVLYYIAPQVWAWRTGRVHSIRESVDLVAAIFPFEEEFYAQYHVPTVYVGHPFLDSDPKQEPQAKIAEELGLDPRRPIIGLLPGSRRSEILKILPVMVKFAARLLGQFPDLQFAIPLAPGIDRSIVAGIVGDVPNIAILSGRAKDILRASTVSVVTSGTATVEAAIAGNPFVVVYRMSRLSYWISRALVRGVSYFAMPNLIAEKKIVEEFLQDEASAENIAEAVQKLLQDKSAYEQCTRSLREVSQALHAEGEETASQRVARLVLALSTHDANRELSE